MQTEMAIFVAPRHPLAAQGQRHPRRAVQLARAAPEHLSGKYGGTGARSVWSAPNYLLLFSMAAQGWDGVFCPAR